jgi:hypothetical protein
LNLATMQPGAVSSVESGFQARTIKCNKFLL